MSSVPEVLKGVVVKAATSIARVPRMGEPVDPRDRPWADLLDRPVDDVPVTDLL